MLGSNPSADVGERGNAGQGPVLCPEPTPYRYFVPESDKPAFLLCLTLATRQQFVRIASFATVISFANLSQST